MENGRVVLELSESCVAVHAQHAPFLTTGVVFVVRTKFPSSSAPSVMKSICLRMLQRGQGKGRGKGQGRGQMNYQALSSCKSCSHRFGPSSGRASVLESSQSLSPTNKQIFSFCLQVALFYHCLISDKKKTSHASSCVWLKIPSVLELKAMDAPMKVLFPRDGALGMYPFIMLASLFRSHGRVCWVRSTKRSRTLKLEKNNKVSEGKREGNLFPLV